MKTIDDIKIILREHKDELASRYRVREIGVFGSFVRNEHNETSDLDVLVEFSEPVSLFEFMDLEDYLENLIEVKIDLVSKKGLKPYIGRNILNEVIYI